MTVFLTGGSGFIGAHVARALLDRGETVRCLARPTSGPGNLDGLPVERVTGDVTDLDSLRRAVAGCDRIFHCAADYRLFAPDPSDLYRNNVEGTRNILRAAAETNVRLVVYTGSVGTLAPSDEGTPVDELSVGSLEHMVGDYKRSKFLAQREVNDWSRRGLPIVSVIPATVVGEGDARPTPTGEIIVDFLNGRMPAYVDTGLNVVDVRDVAAGHVLAAEKGRPGQSYILAHRNIALKELFRMLAQRTGLPAPRVRLPRWLPLGIAHLEAPLARWRGTRPRVSVEAARMACTKMYFDGSKAVRELGLPQSPIEGALDRAIAWFVEKGLARRPQPRSRSAA